MEGTESFSHGGHGDHGLYATALAFELRAAGISYERERPIIVDCRGVPPITGQRADFVVADSVILEKGVGAGRPDLRSRTDFLAQRLSVSAFSAADPAKA
jgi:hypothetical protein